MPGGVIPTPEEQARSRMDWNSGSGHWGKTRKIWVDIAGVDKYGVIIIIIIIVYYAEAAVQ